MLRESVAICRPSRCSKRQIEYWKRQLEMVSSSMATVSLNQHLHQSYFSSTVMLGVYIQFHAHAPLCEIAQFSEQTKSRQIRCQWTTRIISIGGLGGFGSTTNSVIWVVIFNTLAGIAAIQSSCSTVISTEPHRLLHWIQSIARCSKWIRDRVCYGRCA